MNKSTGHFQKDRYLLCFEGGPLDGQQKRYPYLPEPRFGKRVDGEQFWYRVESVDEATGKVKMVPG